MSEYEEIKLKLQVGDRIKSKKGILLESSFGNFYNEYELEYLGNGKWKSIGKRDTLEKVEKLSKK